MQYMRMYLLYPKVNVCLVNLCPFESTLTKRKLLFKTFFSWKTVFSEILLAKYSGAMRRSKNHYVVSEEKVEDISVLSIAKILLLFSLVVCAIDRVLLIRWITV